MRKQHYINQLNAKDEKLLFVLKNSQHISQAQILLLISRSRADNFCKEGVIRKVHYIADGRQQTAYELTHKGKQFIKSNYPSWGSKYYSSSTAVRHNIALANIVMQYADSKTWRNENELREMMMERITDSIELRFQYIQQLERNEISVCDGAVVNRETGEIEQLIEITNDNYTSEIIQQKENFGAIFNSAVTFVHQ